MEKKRDPDDQAPTTADAFAPPPSPIADHKKMLLTIVAVVAVCVAVVLLALSLG